MRDGQIQQAVRRLGRDAGAGRVLKPGVGQIEPGRRLFQYGLEPFDVRARGRVGDADDLDLMRAQQGAKVEVAGIVHHHRIAGPQQIAARQIDGMGAGGGQQHLILAELQPLGRQTTQQDAAQRPRAEHAAIVGQEGVVRPRDGAQGLAQRLGRHPVRRQPAAAGLEGLRRRLQRLARHPEGVDGAVVQAGIDCKTERRQGGARDVEA